MTTTGVNGEEEESEKRSPSPPPPSLPSFNHEVMANKYELRLVHTNNITK